MKKIILSVFATILLAACSNKNTFTVEGTLVGGENKNIYIEQNIPDEEPLFIDSLQLDDKGHFTFSHEMPYKTFYNIHVNQFNYIVLLPSPKEKIAITGNYDNLQETYNISGSPESILLWQLQDYSNMGNNAVRELAERDRKNQDSLSEKQYAIAKQETDSIFIENYRMQQEYVGRFINENFGSLSTLIALYKPFNANMPLLPPETSFTYYELVLDGLQKELPDNPHTIHFKNTVEILRHKYEPKAQAAQFEIGG